MSLEVPRGAFVVLLGLNGAGKSTLFALVTRLYDNVSGKIRIFGYDVRRRASAALQRLGVVFQSRTLDLDLSLKQNLLYHCALHGIRGREARAAHDNARSRSSGSQTAAARRCATCPAARPGASRSPARCCIAPRCCLLDEPTVGLDIGSRESVIKIVRSLVQSEGLGVLWATHLFDEVQPTDLIVVLHKGRVLYYGHRARALAQNGNAKHQRRLPDDHRDDNRGVPHELQSATTQMPGKGAAIGPQESAWDSDPPRLGPRAYLTCFEGIVWREVLRYLHQRERFLSALVRPLVWLFIFAAGFRQTLGVSIIPPYETYVLYEVFITPGLVGMIQLFNAMQTSLSMVYDRETGAMRTLLVSPFPRSFLLLSKLVGGVAVSLLQVYAFCSLPSIGTSRAARRC